MGQRYIQNATKGKPHFPQVYLYFSEKVLFLLLLGGFV